MFAAMTSRHFARPILAALLALAALPARAQTVGHCRFDLATLTFAGAPAEQAECLLQKVRRAGELSPQRLPPALRQRIASEAAPSPQALAAALAAFPEPYRAYASEHARTPASVTQGGLPLRYLVIHDTSTPFLGREPFPPHLDRDARVNSFDAYLGPEPVAHIFLNRFGQIWPGHELAEPWRATKLETRQVGVAARGRFVHIELVQPRRYARGSTSLGDTLAPKPGFSPEQYRQLAALYVYASARAGIWLIPAFHATLDSGLDDAHDDPQNFELKAFAREVERLSGA